MHTPLLQEGKRQLNVNASEQSQIGRSILEHAVRQAAASLIRTAGEAGKDALQYAHGGSGSPSVARLLDLTLHLGAQRQIDTGAWPSFCWLSYRATFADIWAILAGVWAPVEDVSSPIIQGGRGVGIGGIKL